MRLPLKAASSDGSYLPDLVYSFSDWAGSILEADTGSESRAETHFMRSVPRGLFVFAKATQKPTIVHDNLAHSRRYLEIFFSKQHEMKRKVKT